MPTKDEPVCRIAVQSSVLALTENHRSSTIITCMRRLWLTLLLTFSLAFGGVASAWAAQDCPYKAKPETHDCCPEGQGMKMPADNTSKKPADCHLGQACRTSIAVAPILPMLTVVVLEPASLALPRVDADAPTALSFSFWRPPRAV